MMRQSRSRWALTALATALALVLVLQRPLSCTPHTPGLYVAGHIVPPAIREGDGPRTLRAASQRMPSCPVGDQSCPVRPSVGCAPPLLVSPAPAAAITMAETPGAISVTHPPQAPPEGAAPAGPAGRALPPLKRQTVLRVLRL